MIRSRLPCSRAAARNARPAVRPYVPVFFNGHSNGPGPASGSTCQLYTAHALFAHHLPCSPLSSSSTASWVSSCAHPPGAQRRRFSTDGSGIVALVTYNEDFCFEKSSQDSAVCVRYPFSADLRLCKEYRRWDGRIRIGKLMEDMDTAAGDVASRHTYIPPGTSNGSEKSVPMHTPDNVTACVDDIKIAREVPKIFSTSFENIVDDTDMHNKKVDAVLDARLVSASRSSMLIRVRVSLVPGTFRPDARLCGPREPDATVRPPRTTCDTGDSQRRLYNLVAEASLQHGIPSRIGQNHTGAGTQQFAAEGLYGLAEGRLEEGGREALLDAYFLFVAIDPKSRKAVRINGLRLDSERERADAAAGEARKGRRKEEAARSLERIRPTEAEAEYVHQMYVRGAMQPAASRDDMWDLATAGGAPAAPGRQGMACVPVSSTRMRTFYKTQPQEQNSGGKIFGGQLMRQAFELAYQDITLFAAAAAKHGNEDAPELEINPVFVDDVSFLKPVSIGSEICFTSHVAYTSRDHAQVIVSAEIFCHTTRQKFLSNNFSYTFRAVGGAAGGVAAGHGTRLFPFVLPSSYPDMMLNLQGRRALKKYLASAGLVRDGGAGGKGAP